MGQCGGCRLPATLRDPNTGKAYMGGYVEPVQCILDPDIGLEYVYADNPRLNLEHHEIMAQGAMVEDAMKAIRNSEDNRARYLELKATTGCRGASMPITILEYTDASTFLEYPVAHCMALGLHSQIFKHMRDILGAHEFHNACRRADKRSSFILRPSAMKRPVKRILPESSLNLLSGYKVEDHQHSIECFHIIVFHRNFRRGPERDLFKCPKVTIDKVYHIYWRFISCTMFLFRGADRCVATIHDPIEVIERKNELIRYHRLNFDKDVEVLCKLCEATFGPTSCTPNLHSLHHMIRRLIEIKGHPTFEMIVERLVRMLDVVL